MWSENPSVLFQRGGPVMWPILFCLILALAVMFERLVLLFVWYGESYRRLSTRLQQAVRQGGVEQARPVLQASRSPLARVAQVYLDHAENSASLRQEVVSREASCRLTQLESRLHWLSVIGALAPMLGLLGTVTGLVECFRRIELLSGQVQPSDLAAGIWEAPLTTVFGLVVAIPTLAAYHFLEQRVNLLQLQMQWLVTSLDEWLGREPARSEPAAPPAVPKEVQTEVIISAGD